MKRILFFYAKSTLKTRAFQTFPLGVLSIASYLEQEGYEVKIIDRTYDRVSPQKIIKDFDPDLVAITVLSATVYNDAIYLSKIAKNNDLPVAWGGFMASALYDCVLKEEYVDYVVRGEGEITFAELLRCLSNGCDVKSVKGLAFKDRGVVVKNEDREFADLTQFPVTNWDLIDIDRYLIPYIESEKTAFIYASKGCYGKCTFCYNSYWHKCKKRNRPIEHVISEMEYLIRNHGVDGFYFSDELFYYPKDEMEKFYLWRDEHPEFKFVWGIQCRVNSYTKEKLDKMHDYGCRWAFFGIEGGTVERMKIIKKGITFEQEKRAQQYCKELGIATVDSFIIGYPGETVDELKETIKNAKMLECENPSFNIYFPQPESEDYYTLIDEEKYKKPTSFKLYSERNLGNESVVNFSQIPEIDLRVVHYWWIWNSMTKTPEGKIGSQKENIILEYIKIAFRRLKKYGFAEFVVFSVMNIKQYLLTLWYSHAYPSIIKKYELEEKKSKVK